MVFQLPELSTVGITCGIAGFVAAIILIANLLRGPNLDAFPSVHSKTWFGSWWAGFKYVTNAQSIVQEGYELYKSAPFKVAEPNRWKVILGNRQHLEEVAKSSDDEFSFMEAINDHIQIEYLLGPEVFHNPYHATVIRDRFARNLEVLCPDIVDEIVASFAEVLDLRGHEWKSIQALSAIQKIVFRTSNRVFVGLPLCRDPDWINLNLHYAAGFIAEGVMISFFPRFLRSLATRLLVTRTSQSIARGTKLLTPIIEDRLRYLNQDGAEWEDRPNDLLTWLMEKADGPELMAQRLTTRVLFTNFASIHTTANLFTQALFHLATNPQYVQALREEVEVIIEKDGWSKAALTKMRKVDSFLRECQRMEGSHLSELSTVTLSRKALKDFTFSDGTFIPKGTTVSAATVCLHHDNAYYENPDKFEPFRFTQASEEEDRKYQFTTASTEYLPFGHGRHRCPGRFFAATELKFMVAHVLMTYDVKLEDGATYPPSMHISIFITANSHAKVLFRNRVR